MTTGWLRASVSIIGVVAILGCGADVSRDGDGSGDGADTGGVPSGGALTCDVLANPNNCWAAFAAEIASCLPEDEIGVLAGDRSECTFSDGSVVRFGSPLPQQATSLGSLNYTTERDGEVCGTFVDTFDNRMEIYVDDQLVVAELVGGREFRLECPGGTFTSSFDMLFDCAAEGAPPPTDGFRVEPDLVEMSISAITTPGVLFSCTPTGE